MQVYQSIIDSLYFRKSIDFFYAHWMSDEGQVFLKDNIVFVYGLYCIFEENESSFLEFFSLVEKDYDNGVTKGDLLDYSLRIKELIAVCRALKAKGKLKFILKYDA